jgi:hypothetical protein
MVFTPTNPMFFHLLNFHPDQVSQIRCEIQCLLTTIPALTHENTMSIEVLSPSWIALSASNQLKRDYPRRYINKNRYDIQSVELIIGQNPPPIPRALIELLAEFGLKRHPKLANKRRPCRPLYTIPQRRTSPSN